MTPKQYVKYHKGQRVRVELSARDIELINLLTAIGYRRTSSRHLLVSRLDRRNWYTKLPAAVRRGDDQSEWADWADWYRRTLSKDKLELPFRIFACMPESSGRNELFIATTLVQRNKLREFKREYALNDFKQVDWMTLF